MLSIKENRSRYLGIISFILLFLSFASAMVNRTILKDGNRSVLPYTDLFGLFPVMLIILVGLIYLLMPEQSKSRKIKRRQWILRISFVSFFLMSVFLHYTNFQTNKRRRMDTVFLKHFYCQLAFYADDHQNVYPKVITDLFPNYLNEKHGLVQLLTQHSNRSISLESIEGNQIDYAYLGGKVMTNQLSNEIIMHTGRDHLEDDWITVLFADGRLVLHREDELDSLLAKCPLTIKKSKTE